MKKLAVFFIVLISLVVIAGCNNTKKTVTRFSTEDTGNGTTTTITEIKEEVTMEPIEIPVVSEEDEGDAVEFAITSHAGEKVNSDKGYHLIQGVAPSNAYKIMVNNYELNKYKRKEGKWSYVAATSLGNLKKGDNLYTIQALDKKGDEIASKTLTITYKGIDSGSLVDTGSGLNLVILMTLFGLISFYSLRKQFS